LSLLDGLAGETTTRIWHEVTATSSRVNKGALY